MVQSVYIIGGAGTGKSTFMRQLLERLPEPGPLVDLHSKPNSRGTVITLRGHEVGDGIYLGSMRDGAHPGTDALDRISYVPGDEWLLEGHHERYAFVVGEGATLAVHRFMSALHETTNLLLIHLWADDWVKELRFASRGTTQAENFVKSTATGSENLLKKMQKEGAEAISLDSVLVDPWLEALDRATEHLLDPEPPY